MEEEEEEEEASSGGAGVAVAVSGDHRSAAGVAGEKSNRVRGWIVSVGAGDGVADGRTWFPEGQVEEEEAEEEEGPAADVTARFSLGSGSLDTLAGVTAQFDERAEIIVRRANSRRASPVKPRAASTPNRNATSSRHRSFLPKALRRPLEHAQSAAATAGLFCCVSA